MKIVIEAMIGAIFSILIIVSGILLFSNAQAIFDKGDMTPVSSIKILGYGTMGIGAISLILSVFGSLRPIGHKLVQLTLSVSIMLVAVAFISIFGMSLIVKPTNASGYITTIATPGTGNSTPAGNIPMEMIIGVLGASLGAISLAVFKMFFGGIVVKVSSFSTEAFNALKTQNTEAKTKNVALKDEIKKLELEKNNKNELNVELIQKSEDIAKRIASQEDELHNAEKQINTINETIKQNELKAKLESDKSKEAKHSDNAEESKETKNSDNAEESKETKNLDKAEESKKSKETKKSDKTEELKKQSKDEQIDNKANAKALSVELQNAKKQVEEIFAKAAKSQSEITNSLNEFEKTIAKEKDLIAKHSNNDKPKHDDKAKTGQASVDKEEIKPEVGKTKDKKEVKDKK